MCPLLCLEKLCIYLSKYLQFLKNIYEGLLKMNIVYNIYMFIISSCIKLVHWPLFDTLQLHGMHGRLKGKTITANKHLIFFMYTLIYTFLVTTPPPGNFKLHCKIPPPTSHQIGFGHPRQTQLSIGSICTLYFIPIEIMYSSVPIDLNSNFMIKSVFKYLWQGNNFFLRMPKKEIKCFVRIRSQNDLRRNEM